MAGKARSAGLPIPIDLEAGGRRARQAPNRSRLARRSDDHAPHDARHPRRSPSRWPSPRRPRPQALNVYAASSLRDVFPAIDRARPTTSSARTRCSCRSSAARPPTSSRPPARPRRRRCSRRACCTRPGDVRDEQARPDRPEGQPGQHHARSTRCAPAARRLSIGNAGVPIGAYTRPLLRAPAAVVDPQHEHRQPARPTSPASSSKVALGSADAGFVYVTDGRIAARPHRR